MKILQVHNYYQRPGGEDVVVAAERDLLQSYGHQVVQYTRHNDAVNSLSRLQLFRNTISNLQTEHEVRKLLAEESPDLIHSHNTFPLISPSLYYAAAEAEIPVIQTLHNFRLLCPSATLFRDGKICEDCIGRVPYPAVLHSCYRGNRGASAAAASMITAHRLLGTWQTKIHTYIALTEFSRNKFIEGGLDPNKIAVKPNFLPVDPGIGDGSGNYVLFAGRLAKEKGLGVLLDAWERLQTPIPLKIAGDGELKSSLQQRAARIPNIEFLGHCERDTVLGLLRKAALLVAPSEWYEGLPMTIIEAFGCGTPVMTSWLPSMDSVVIDGVQGRRFENGSPDDLARRLDELWGSPSLRYQMRQAARAAYEARYTPAINYPQLINIYRQALETSGTMRLRTAVRTVANPELFRTYSAVSKERHISTETKN